MPGQLPAFFTDEAERPVVELPYVGPGVDREEITYRAGTRLDHRWTHKIMGRGRRGPLVHGLYDESQRVFQTGGEMSAFVYWKHHLVTLSEDAWKKVKGIADWIEIVDHETNRCWRIAKVKFLNHAVRYDAGIGPRVGCAMDLWDVIDARGNYWQEGKLK